MRKIREFIVYQSLSRGFSLIKQKVLRENGRNLLATFSGVVLLVILRYVAYGAFTSDLSILGRKPFNELTKAAIDIRLDQTKTMFQIGSAIIIALWGLLVAKKEEAVLVSEDWQELWMSISAAALLCGSFICHLTYLNIATDLYSSAGNVAGTKLENKAQISDKYTILNDSTIVKNDLKIDETINIPDIFDPAVNYLFIAQMVFLSAGILIAALTFLSAHILKPKD